MWNGTPYTASQKDARSIDLLVDRLPGSGEDGLTLLSDIFSPHSQDIGILAAPSGSGKTRGVLEFLSLKWGIYFITTTQGNGGSPDFSSTISIIMGEIDKSRPDGNDAVVSRNLTKLLYLRLLILSRLLALKPELTPFEWLVLQLYPQNYFGKDVFYSAFSSAQNLNIDQRNIEQLNLELDPLLGKRLVVFVDEAQELVKQVGFFVSADGHHPRPLFSPVSRFFQSTVLKTFFIGTGLEMTNSLLWASNILKKVDFSTQPISLGYFDATFAWDHYVGKYLPEKEREKFEKQIFPKLQGRVRFFAVFIQAYLEAGNKADLINAFDLAHRLAMGNSTYSLVSQLNKISSLDAVQIDLVQNIANAFLFGRPLSLRPDTVEQVVNAGLAYFTDKGESREPLFKEAMFLYFRKHLQENYLYLQISSMDIGSMQGYEFETLLAARLFSQMERAQKVGGTLAVALDLDTPFRLLQEKGKEDPKLRCHLDCPFSFLPEARTLVPLLRRAGDESTLQTYVNEKSSYFFSSPQGNESDIVIVVKLDTSVLPEKLTKGETSKYFGIGIQCKLYGPDTSLQKTQEIEMKKILDTTDLRQKNPSFSFAGVLRLLAPLGFVFRNGVDQLKDRGFNAVAYPGVGMPTKEFPDFISVLTYGAMEPKEGHVKRVIFTPNERDWIWQKIEKSKRK